MTKIRSAIFAAATAAATFGAMAGISNAQAFYFGYNGGGTSIGINLAPRTCWRWVDTYYGPQYVQFWGRDCRR